MSLIVCTFLDRDSACLMSWLLLLALREFMEGDTTPKRARLLQAFGFVVRW